jgi:hypothetical protein
MKFLRQTNLTAQEARALNIEQLLLLAPKKPRTKYGKRRSVSAEERAELSRQRNKEHARATRLRRKLFQKVAAFGLYMYSTIVYTTSRRYSTDNGSEESSRRGGCAK